ncbi:MAG TPA: DUF4301 family protein [Bacteroidales bacterium]|nr:DUF4301 family protein [Bacteroidales bacterium]HPS50665.1 DUF4301 family protein [Bacteroidales bacterium]
MVMLNQQDLAQIEQKGIDPVKIRKQIDHFIKGFPFVSLVRPASPSDGLMVFDETDRDRMIELFASRQPGLKIVKFVPASGAASRMFKHLFEFREKYTEDQSGMHLYLADKGPHSVFYLMTHLESIAFYQELRDMLAKDGFNLSELLEYKSFNKIIEYILTEKGLNYSNLPKGLIKFHRYPDGARTSAEEHLVETIEYTRDNLHVARLHFTISTEHRDVFRKLVAAVIPSLEQKYRVNFDITFSVQKPSTDIIAVDENNLPVRNESGTLLFRPGGHGALIENLNEIDADLIFIKNIDNIVPDRLKGTTYQYKKLLGGYLIHLRDEIFGHLNKIQSGRPGDLELNRISAFAEGVLHLDIPGEFLHWPVNQKADFLFNLLNRPIRVCGMVKNEGEPGGGPFWIVDGQGKNSLQIVESSQIDLNNEQQRLIVKSSTHFNPVDLVCCIRDFSGKKFDLNQFIDENTGFITLKSSGGMTLKAQELPGLWNGSMAHWITLFVEVPIITFNPVKTVNDLLRKEHLES